MDDLTVKGVTVQDQVRFANGHAVKVKHLVFYVGNHGPFMADFPSTPEATNAIQAYIAQEVQNLRAITTRNY